ncbi:MAG TPA: hypothetical protein DDZ89_18335, partial [Clostridiales bacterium]|nr:hypothetical protein [Clostridiales bacterium]
NPSITYALPQNPNIQALAGTKTKTLAMQKMENTLKSMINPKDLATALATTIISNMVSDTLAKSSNKAQEMAARIGSYASEGKALSSAFEKIAMDKQNEEMLSVARLMSLSTLFNEKVASTLNESHVYPRIYDTAKDIMEERAVLEKTAYNLMQLKAKQYKERNEIVNPNYIQGAVEQLDKLYKVAYGVCSAKYDMNKIMEKEAAYNFKKLSPSRLQRAMTKVSKKTGIPEKTIAAVLVGTAVTGTGVGVTGAKLAEKKKMAKTAGAASSALTGGLHGGLYGAGKNYDKAVKKEKEKNPEVLPSDYGPVATSKAL